MAMYTLYASSSNVTIIASGSQPLLPSIQREDAATEERIAHILNEAQHAMQQKKTLEQVWAKEVVVYIVEYGVK